MPMSTAYLRHYIWTRKALVYLATASGQNKQGKRYNKDRLLDDYWKERYRITIKISGNNLVSSVKVSCQVQEKARGGSAAYRWERKKSTGEREEEALMRIEEILSEG